MKKKDIVNQRIGEMVQNDELSNADLISIIEHAGMFLNLRTVSDYARAESIS
jgi:transcriptional regulator NrdR family protein